MAENDAASMRLAADQVRGDGGDGGSVASALVAQAYRLSFHETIAPPSNAPLSRVVRAPVDFAHDSKRAQLIEDAQVDLEHDMDELQRAVHASNVDFQRRMDDVRARGTTLETQIRFEYEAMEESMNQLQHAFTAGFAQSFATLEQTMRARFARVEAQELAHQEHRIRDGEADARRFFYATVPEIMDTLQGTITRTLDKHHETFDIENAKTQTRERKTLGVVVRNEQRTQDAFAAERARRELQCRAQEEDSHNVMRVDNRASERRQSDCVETLVSLRAQLQHETRVRATDDAAVLDKVGTAFSRLQTSILENLGETTA